MTRKKHRRYKLVEPVAVVTPEPWHRLLLHTIIGWAIAGCLIGVLIAFLLIGSVFTPLKIGAEIWFRIWPASLRLLTTPGLDGHQTTHLAFWLAGENGLLYGAASAGIGAAHGGFRILRRGRARR